MGVLLQPSVLNRCICWLEIGDSERFLEMGGRASQHSGFACQRELHCSVRIGRSLHGQVVGGGRRASVALRIAAKASPRQPPSRIHGKGGRSTDPPPEIAC